MAASSKIGSSTSLIKGRWPRQQATILEKLCHQEHNMGHLPPQGIVNYSPKNISVHDPA